MHELLARLSSVLPAERISADPAYLDEITWDAWSESRIHPNRRPDIATPLCAVSPIDTEEVRRLLLFANAERVAVVPYGGGSGLMGGAVSVQPSIVVDMRKMNRILAIDAEARSARVQAGVVLETLDSALNEHGFILGHDPWTVPVATVGGAIATNSVGYRAGVYGSMGDQVLGLEAVMATGEILRTRGVEKSSTGIDLNAVLIGGEGCFGIITEATIRIFPAPAARWLKAFQFASFESGYRAIQELFRQRLTPALLDFGDDAEESADGALLYLAFEGDREIAEADGKRALAIAQQHGGRTVPGGAAERFWRERHAIARRFAQNRRARRNQGNDGYYRDWIHVALPASKVLSFRTAALGIAEKRGVRVLESGLWIQPELFSLRLGSEETDGCDARLALEDTVDDLLTVVAKMGGSIEYTHGVGLKLAPFMAAEHGYGLTIMRQIKNCLDPNRILNPGKLGL
jgi:FAD/FMN-containing dehydrogenase